MPYRRYVAYGLGKKGRKSQKFERRNKHSFRKWLRRKDKLLQIGFKDLRL